jgi:hypothetical protein
MSTHASHVTQRRPGLIDTIAGRLGSALVSWSERPRAIDPRVVRLNELDELRESARAGGCAGVRF